MRTPATSMPNQCLTSESRRTCGQPEPCSNSRPPNFSSIEVNGFSSSFVTNFDFFITFGFGLLTS